MARYVLTADLTFEGLPYLRGDILNAPQALPAIVAAAASITGVPRVRPAGLDFQSPFYQAVATADRLGLQTATNTFPAGQNVIPEPQLPTANKQYD